MSIIPSAPGAGNVSPAEQARFSAICETLMRMPWSGKQGTVGIGTLREKRLHAAIKAYICPDTACHERSVSSDRDGTDGPPVGRASPGMVADILIGDSHNGDIYEIQTGGFFPLKKKVAWYLSMTGCHVTVVHPIPAVKYLTWLDPRDGQVMSRRRSPRRGQVKDVAGELYWLSDYVGHPRFTLCLLFVDLEEYRLKNGWSRDGKRGSARYERFPTALRGRVELSSASDYANAFLPASLSARPFTAAEYQKASGIRGRAAYGMLHLLVRLGVLAEAGRIGRAGSFIRVTEAGSG